MLTLLQRTEISQRGAVVHGGVLDPGVNFLSKPFALDQLTAKVRMVWDA